MMHVILKWDAEKDMDLLWSGPAFVSVEWMGGDKLMSGGAGVRLSGGVGSSAILYCCPGGQRVQRVEGWLQNHVRRVEGSEKNCPPP